MAVGRHMRTVIVTLHGNLDLSASVLLAGVPRDLIDGQGNMAVVVDLADVASRRRHSRRTAMNAHPAGSGRPDPTTQGDAS